MHSLWEKLIKGDTGDGVPNILSDDTFVVEGKRQRPISTKKMELWKTDKDSWTEDVIETLIVMKRWSIYPKPQNQFV